MIMNPMAQLFATSDLDVAGSAFQQGFKLLYIGDEMDMPREYPFINAITFTPDYKAICAVLEGNEEAFKQLYFQTLQTPVSEEMFAVIISALTKGQKILLFFPKDTIQLKYPYLLLEYMAATFGLKAGDKSSQFTYNPLFDFVNFRLMYLHRLVTWQDYIMQVDALDPIVLIKLREDLCGLYNIPTNISDEDMTKRVEQIKHDLFIQAHKGKKLFSKVSKEEK